MLFPALAAPSDDLALRFGDRSLSYTDLAGAVGALAAALPAARVAVWAEPRIETAVAVAAGLLAGSPVIPLNPKVGDRELAHILGDSHPEAVLCGPDAVLPDALAQLTRIAVDPAARATPADLTAAASDDPAMIVYTSGTTGPPKGVVLSRRAIAATLDNLVEAWAWTARDVVLHALPLFHVHGLVLGVLGPLRRGGTAHHIARFSPGAAGAGIASWDRPVMMFGVPTMYHRLADAVQADPALAATVGRARLLISGSAALALHDHERLTRATGHHVVERYGMTETLMNTSVPAGATARPGTVGVPLPGMALRLVDESGAAITARDGETIGEIQMRGNSLFTEYLNRPDATAEAFDGSWFRTGDVATMDGDGYVRIVGRKATDLIKSGGFKIGAGEIENALIEHPGVAEVAVTGEPDPDLGERIVAWVVPAGPAPSADELADHVTRLLSAHKRPRVVRFVDALPRNELGKVTKRALRQV